MLTDADVSEGSPDVTEYVHERLEAAESCCDPTIALVCAASPVRVCPVCGETYYLAPSLTPLSSRPEPRPGLDLGVGEVPEPSARRSSVRVRDPEAAEVALVRRLLCELRPETDGPLGWGPYDLPPAEQVKPTPPIRVQNGAGECDIPRGAFQRAIVEPLAEVRKRLDRVGDVDELAARVLVHLQRRGTLAHGYAALAVGVAHAVADQTRLRAWHADPSRAWDRARLWGARQVELAAERWAAAEVRHGA
jgi:hypothetical protein